MPHYTSHSSITFCFAIPLPLFASLLDTGKILKRVFRRTSQSGQPDNSWTTVEEWAGKEEEEEEGGSAAEPLPPPPPSPRPALISFGNFFTMLVLQMSFTPARPMSQLPRGVHRYFRGGRGQARSGEGGVGHAAPRLARSLLLPAL